MLDVSNFYDYLWQRRRGIMHLEIIDAMPRTMRAEVFYDVNKFVFDQVINALHANFNSICYSAYLLIFSPLLCSFLFSVTWIMPL